MVKVKEINTAERKIIEHLWKKRKSLSEIGQIVESTHSSVQRVVDNFKNTGALVTKPRLGRPPKLTDLEKIVIVYTVKENSRLTSSKIAENWNVQFQETVSTDTVRRILKEANYRSRIAR